MYYHYYLQACFVSMHLALTALDKNDVNIFSIIFSPISCEVYMYFCVLRYVYRIRSLQYIHDEIFTYMSSNISPCIYSILPNYTNTSQCPRCMVTVQQMLLLNGIPISSVIRHQFLHACSFYLTNSASVFFAFTLIENVC